MDKLGVKYQFKENTIYCGDNLDVLKDFPDECVDLIYIDPPFFSNRTYEVIWEDGYELRSFEDRWEGGIQHYLGWMRPRLEQLYRILKTTGSFYLHCDYHASHHLKIMCDEIFRLTNFRNEIVWHYKTFHGLVKKYYPKNTISSFFMQNLKNGHSINYLIQIIKKQLTIIAGKNG